jgi:hypothetical protein
MTAIPVITLDEIRPSPARLSSGSPLGSTRDHSSSASD